MNYFYRYLPLAEEVRRNGLYVLAGGYHIIPPNTSYPPIAHPGDHDFRWSQGRTLQEYQMIYITRGRGKFESHSGGTRPIEAGTLFVLFPGEWHRYSPTPDTGWDEYWLAFQGHRAGQCVAKYALTKETPTLEVGLSEMLREEFVRVTEEIRGEALGYQNIVSAQVPLILARAAALAQRQAFEVADVLSVMARAKHLLLENVAQTMNVEELAASLGVGYSWFRRAFRQYTGLSPAQYHMQLRLHHSRDLLRATRLPVATVGQRSGFDSAYHFSHIFKKKTGLTPGEYRAMSQGRPVSPTVGQPMTLPKSAPLPADGEMEDGDRFT